MEKTNGSDIVAAYYAEHIAELRAFIMLRLADRAKSEDMAQDVFVRLLDYGKMITEQTLPCLVYTVARRLLADHYRHLQAIRNYHCVQRVELYERDTPHDLCLANELTATLEHAIGQLPENSRELYRLSVYDGMKVSGIAEELHLGYKAAERRLGLARKEVRRRVREAG